MRSSGLRWLWLPATALLLASCAVPYDGYYGGYPAHGSPAYAYPNDYHAPAYGGFAFGGGHPHFRHRFVSQRFGGHFGGHRDGGEHPAMSAHAGHGGGHHR